MLAYESRRSPIGQLGNPHYLQKANALYCEFEEVGVDKQFGFGSPFYLLDVYPRLYFNSVSIHLQSAISISQCNHARATMDFICLYSNVYRAERGMGAD